MKRIKIQIKEMIETDMLEKRNNNMREKVHKKQKTKLKIKIYFEVVNPQKIIFIVLNLLQFQHISIMKVKPA